MDTKHLLIELLFPPPNGLRDTSGYHPERDVLYHSLQVYMWAKRAGADLELRTAALLHNVGKALSFREHASLGADLVDGHFSPRVVDLVDHHLDLLIAPYRTRAERLGTPLLADLEDRRAWDLAGRSKTVKVPTHDQVTTELAHALDHAANHAVMKGA